ncbi:hypothetical protein LguiB_012245 [Lonicera macranthoides]
MACETSSGSSHRGSHLWVSLKALLHFCCDESIFQMTKQLKWMPLLAPSSKLCPPGIEDTFFALLMSIDNAGVLSSSWATVLHITKVTRTHFDKLWLAIILRVPPLCLIFLLLRSDPNASILLIKLLDMDEGSETIEPENIGLVSLVSSVNDR